jgi:Family of unknown function (DUF6364)
MSKLTLSVDAEVVERAKRFAAEHDTSVSEMVENYLSLVVKPAAERPDPPILRSLRGSLKSGDVSDYKKHLVKKYLHK